MLKYLTGLRGEHWLAIGKLNMCQCKKNTIYLISFMLNSTLDVRFILIIFGIPFLVICLCICVFCGYRKYKKKPICCKYCYSNKNYTNKKIVRNNSEYFDEGNTNNIQSEEIQI